VLVHIAWDRYWGNDRYGTKNPFITAAAAGWLVEQQAALVGIDSVNIDDARAVQHRGWLRGHGAAGFRGG
jgi:kynurenine formamidase